MAQNEAGVVQETAISPSGMRHLNKPRLKITVLAYLLSAKTQTRSQFVMRAITSGGFAAVLAAAKEHALAGIRGVFNRYKTCVLVTAIAGGLLGALTASAPEVGFALFNIDYVG